MDKSSLGPKFKRIKEDIVDDILSSVYEPGDMIPSQEDYALKYGVSRLTVRKAIDELVTKGILRTERGKGTFVQEVVRNVYSYRRLTGFTSNVVSRKAKISSKVLSIQQLKADKRLSVKLQIPLQAPVTLVERIRYVNGLCVSFQRAFLANEQIGTIDFVAADLNKNSLYETLRREAGIVLGFVDEHFRAIRATEEVASYLELEVGSPILYVSRVTYNTNNVAVEYCENYESSDVNGIWVKSISI